MNPLDNNPNKQFKSYTLLSLHDAIYFLKMESAQKKNLNFCQTLNGCVIFFDTLSKEYFQKSSTSGTRFSCTHTVEKDASLTWIQTWSTSYAQAIVANFL